MSSKTRQPAIPNNLSDALAYAKGEAYDRVAWNAAERLIVDAGLCPGCACDGRRVEFLPWEPGNYHEYAGCSCPECEEFWPCGEQPQFSDTPDTDASGQCYSDALPGF